MKQALACSTQATYKAGMRQFYHFCRRHHLVALPASKQVLCYFAASASRYLSASTIRTYVTSIAATHRQLGLPNPR